MKREKRTELYNNLQATIQSLSLIEVAAERRELLEPCIHYLRQKLQDGKVVNLVFICTHNSRRSHLAQVWAQAISHWFGYYMVTCYSGGTETTAMYPTVARTLEKSGFTVSRLGTQDNPVYAVKYGETLHPIIAFSKEFSHPFNPTENFAAVMTCMHADENCPYVTGAEVRLSVPYEDPKQFDGTAREHRKYEERSLQIASELYYIFQQALA